MSLKLKVQSKFCSTKIKVHCVNSVLDPTVTLYQYCLVRFSFSIRNLYYPVHLHIPVLTLWSIIHGYIFIFLFVYDICTVVLSWSVTHLRIVDFVGANDSVHHREHVPESETADWPRVCGDTGHPQCPLPDDPLLQVCTNQDTCLSLLPLNISGVSYPVYLYKNVCKKNDNKSTRIKAWQVLKWIENLDKNKIKIRLL